MYYAKHTKAGKIKAKAYNEIDCIDKAVKAVKESFIWVSLDRRTIHTLDFNKFTKEDKLKFLEDNKIMIYQTDLPTKLPNSLQKPNSNL